MTDSTPIMLGTVAMRLRLVYQAASETSKFSLSSASPSSARGRAGAASGGTGVPGWRLVGLLPEDLAEVPDNLGPDTAGDAAGHDTRAHFVTAPITLTLSRDEAEGYYLNLTSPQPSLFALLRLPDVGAATAAKTTVEVPEAEAITVSYSEAARWMDGGMVVIRTPLPEPMLAWIAEFAQYHFQAEGKKKRGKFRPSFLSRQQFGEVAKAEKQDSSLAVVEPLHRRH